VCTITLFVVTLEGYLRYATRLSRPRMKSVVSMARSRQRTSRRSPLKLSVHDVASGRDIQHLIQATREENTRGDTKAAMLLGVVGIGFTAFSVAAASATIVPLRGVQMWLALGALLSVVVVAEILFLAIRPQLSRDLAAKQYFAYWRQYARSSEILAQELKCSQDESRLLTQLSEIAWRKHSMIRVSVDLLIGVTPVMASVLALALLR
jgi:hypothetical protein